jgi:hypothetical protein
MARLTNILTVFGLRAARRADGHPCEWRPSPAAWRCRITSAPNWVALADCLTDVEWVPAKGYVLVLRGLAGLARRSPKDYAMLLGVLMDNVA